jgi:hypothetical protein
MATIDFAWLVEDVLTIQAPEFQFHVEVEGVSG